LYYVSCLSFISNNILQHIIVFVVYFLQTFKFRASNITVYFSVMSDVVDVSLSKRQPQSTAASRSEFAYRTHLVIYNFLRLVPSSLSSSPTDDVANPAAFESPVLFAPLTSQNGDPSGHHEESERGGGDARGVGNAGGNYEWIDRQGMFDELRARVTEREQRRDMLARESKRRAAETSKMLHELMDKVTERDCRIACSVTDPATSVPPAVTIIKKNNAHKFLVDPASPSTTVGPAVTGNSLPIITPHGDSQVSPFVNPLRTSTPSVTPQSVHTPVNGETDAVMGDLKTAADEMSSSGSDSNSAYIDIDIVDDIESLVDAGIVPPVSKSLKDEISLCWQNLELSHSSMF